MSAMGRPKKENPKSRMISFRLNERDYQSVMDYATVKKVTVSKVVQQAVKDFIGKDNAR